MTDLFGDAPRRKGIEGIHVMLAPYELGAFLRVDMDDACVIRLVADWLDQEHPELRRPLLAFLTARMAEMAQEAA